MEKLLFIYFKKKNVKLMLSKNSGIMHSKLTKILGLKLQKNTQNTKTNFLSENNNERKSVILAAGKGTRMKSETPKVLHKIFDKELLGYVLDTLKDITKQNFVIVGHKAQIVEDFVKNNYPNSKCILQEQQLGTGDALKCAYSSLEGFKGNVLITCGDTPLLKTQTIIDFIDFHNNNNSDLSVMSAIFE